MVKAVFFDFYKTLSFWGEDTFKASLKRIVENYGEEVNWDHYGIAIKDFFVDTPVSNTAMDSLLDSVMATMIRECDFIRKLGIQDHVEQIAWELLQSGHPLFAVTDATLYDDVVPTLQHLGEADIILAIVSNWVTPLFPLLERLGIAHYFHTITASHDVRVRSMKPDPHIFEYTLKKVGVTAEETVHVGDTFDADIVGAQGVGIRPILLDRNGTQTSRWEETIQNLAELPELLI
ncbi:hypothetical protein C6497_06715 [Candidatus Poribacteria bacterium]|nr:MAG: hypothetical protein C6497_06715 [Candidatus Poribacteria bacterium]